MNRLLVLSLAAMAACVPPSPADLLGLDDDFFSDDWQMESNARGSMRGELPIVGSFDDADADYAYVDTWGEDTYLELHTNTEDGWGMVALNVEDDALENGVETPVDPELAVGCAGPSEYYADYDEPPEEVVVTRDVIEIDGSQEVVYTLRAQFAGGEVVEGEVSPIPDPGE